MRCYICKEDKPKQDFHKNVKRKSGVNNICKPCRSEYQKQWYRNNRETHIENVSNRKRKLRNKWPYIKERLNIKCEQCDEDDIACLDFHHDIKRDMSVYQAFIWGKEKFEKELNKCIVLCANCHRKLHYYKDQ